MTFYGKLGTGCDLLKNLLFKAVPGDNPGLAKLIEANIFQMVELKGQR